MPSSQVLSSTTRNAASITMTSRKTDVVFLELIQVKCAPMCKAVILNMLAREGTPVRRLIIEWKSSTTPRSTRASSVNHIRTAWRAVTTEKCARSLTQNKRSPLTYYTRWNLETLTSTCSTSRPSGARGVLTTTRRTVCTPTIGKTFGESPTFTHTGETSAKPGR